MKQTNGSNSNFKSKKQMNKWIIWFYICIVIGLRQTKSHGKLHWRTLKKETRGSNGRKGYPTRITLGCPLLGVILSSAMSTKLSMLTGIPVYFFRYINIQFWTYNIFLNVKMWVSFPITLWMINLYNFIGGLTLG